MYWYSVILKIYCLVRKAVGDRERICSCGYMHKLSLEGHTRTWWHWLFPRKKLKGWRSRVGRRLSTVSDLFEIWTMLIYYPYKNNSFEKMFLRRKSGKVHHLMQVYSKHENMLILISNIRNGDENSKTWLFVHWIGKLKGFLELQK